MDNKDDGIYGDEDHPLYITGLEDFFMPDSTYQDYINHMRLFLELPLSKEKESVLMEEDEWNLVKSTLLYAPETSEVNDALGYTQVEIERTENEKVIIYIHWDPELSKFVKMLNGESLNIHTNFYGVYHIMVWYLSAPIYVEREGHTLVGKYSNFFILPADYSLADEHLNFPIYNKELPYITETIPGDK
jgi:hypothetical protein